MKKVNKTVLNKRGYPRLSKQQVEYYKRLCLITGRLPLYTGRILQKVVFDYR